MDSQFDRERGVTPARSHAELPLPVVPLPRPNTNPRPWDVEVEVRQFAPSGDGHPFQIVVATESSEIRMRVRAGRALCDAVHVVSGTTYHTTREMACQFGVASDLLDDEFGTFGGAAGYTVLSPSTTYGVFLYTAYSGAGSGPPNATLEYQSLAAAGWGAALVGTSTTYTSPTDTQTYAASLGSPGYGAAFLGRVVVDASGGVTIQQYRKSDIVFPAMILPEGFISDEAGNNLTASFPANPGLWVRVVSGDTNNSITADADGAAYYDAP